MAERVPVAIVGGGPAGAITGMILARRGIGVTILEAAPSWRWRACGVFTSPATFAELRRLGLKADDLQAVARPVPAMRVETAGGEAFRLTYRGAGRFADSAVGLDRAAFDRLVLDAARDAGAHVRLGARVVQVELAGGGSRLHLATGDALDAGVVVGADGLRSAVAEAAGVTTKPSIRPRIGLTFHVPDPEGDAAHDARIVAFQDGYVGLAPVPGGRLNVGIVLGRSWFDRIRASLADVVTDILMRHHLTSDRSSILDRIAGASPLAHQVSRRAGPGWVLVGDAAGFLDPFTGEGLHRAVVSAELAAEAVVAAAGERGSTGFDAIAAGRYVKGMNQRFRSRDLVTRVVDAFLARPPLFEYVARRLAERPRPRETLGLVIGDMLPADRALDPRFLASVLRP